MNYVECSSNLNKKLFFFVDNSQNVSNNIFIANKLKVRYCSEIRLDFNNYKILFVKVPITQEELFINCMEELNDKMVLRGFRDYKDVCKIILNDDYLYKKKVKKRV